MTMISTINSLHVIKCYAGQIYRVGVFTIKIKMWSRWPPWWRKACFQCYSLVRNHKELFPVLYPNEYIIYHYLLHSILQHKQLYFQYAYVSILQIIQMISFFIFHMIKISLHHLLHHLFWFKIIYNRLRNSIELKNICTGNAHVQSMLCYVKVSRHLLIMSWQTIHNVIFYNPYYIVISLECYCPLISRQTYPSCCEGEVKWLRRSNRKECGGMKF